MGKSLKTTRGLVAKTLSNLSYVGTLTFVFNRGNPQTFTGFLIIPHFSLNMKKDLQKEELILVQSQSCCIVFYNPHFKFPFCPYKLFHCHNWAARHAQWRQLVQAFPFQSLSFSQWLYQVGVSEPQPMWTRVLSVKLALAVLVSRYVYPLRKWTGEGSVWWY